MIINEKEIVKVIQHGCDALLDYKDIDIYDMEVQIEEYIKIQVKAKYYKVDTLIQVIAKVQCDEQIHIKTKGVIKYGFIHLDFNKVMKEHVKNMPHIQVVEDGILIDNPYFKDIQYGHGNMTIEWK